MIFVGAAIVSYPAMKRWQQSRGHMPENGSIEGPRCKSRCDRILQTSLRIRLEPGVVYNDALDGRVHREIAESELGLEFKLPRHEFRELLDIPWRSGDEPRSVPEKLSKN